MSTIITTHAGTMVVHLATGLSCHGEIDIAIADQLVASGAVLQIGRSAYDPGDAMGKMMFNIMATFAEFEADLIRQHLHRGLVISHPVEKRRAMPEYLVALLVMRFGRLSFLCCFSRHCRLCSLFRVLPLTKVSRPSGRFLLGIRLDDENASAR